MSSQQHQQISSQQGGMITSFQTFLMNLDSPFKLLYGFLLIILIVYAPLVPGEIRIIADSLVGRIIGIAIIYGVIEAFGWVYGLLTALAFLVILNGASRTVTLLENFDGGGTVSEKKIIGKRWFVEKVLGEHPRKIATDRVTTSAIED
jgi:hypothetical protein